MRVGLVGELLGVATDVAAAAGYRGRLQLVADTKKPLTSDRQALPTLILFVGEAVRNAIRHAHPAGIAGTISLGCRVGPMGETIVEIRDDGVGLPDGFDESHHAGTGFRLMRAAAARLGAGLTLRSSPLGLRLRLRLPPEAHGRQATRSRAADQPVDPAMLEALPIGVYVTDTGGGITYFNSAAASLWGRRPERGEKWSGAWKLCDADGVPLERGACPMAVALREGREQHGAEAIAERPDGSRVPLMLFPTLLRGADGVVTGAVNVMIEIGERKRAEQRQKLLTGELQHRTKNLFAIARAVVAQSLRDSTLQAARELALGRLRALGDTYDKLYAAGWQGATLGDVVRDELEPFSERVEIDGPTIVLSPRAAQSFALAVHELATNAAKHGALSAAMGRVSVSWKLAGEGGELRFRWIEQDGPPVAPPKRRGFGSVVLEQLVAQDFGCAPTILFAPNGLTCELTTRLTSVVMNVPPGSTT